MSHRLIEEFYRKLQPVLMDRPRFAFRRLSRMLYVLALFCLLALLDDIFYRAIALVLVWMAVEAILKTVNSFPVNMLVTGRYDAKEKARRLKEAVAANRLYEDAELTLATLAGKLKIHPHDLSRIINTGVEKNFNDFINEFRVREVARKMMNPAFNQFTLLGIAYESGFNSKTSFNRVFKEMTGKTPTEYKKAQEKEVPIDKLVLRSQIRPVILRLESQPIWADETLKRNIMFRNYFKTAWRNLLRNKSYAAINITGLAIGIAACLLIFLVVQYETSFDNFHTQKDHIYRVVNVSYDPDGKHLGSGTQIPLADGLKLEFPQLQHVGSIMLNDGSQYEINDGNNGSPLKKFKEDLAYYADPAFFQIFDFKWLAGDKRTALSEPNTVVLSRDEADKFFGDWHTAVGKTVTYENKRDLKVTGILENTPPNTDFPMKLVMSWRTLVTKGGDLAGNTEDWISTFSDRNTYIILPAGLGEAKFDSSLAAFAKKRIPAPYNKNSSLQLQALKDMHYNTQVNVYGGHPFSKELINVISLIGIFLLLIACVNFINLATAQAVNRSKEVGIRKVLGGKRSQLVLQFISETLLITLFAVVLATGIAVITIPMLNGLLEIHLGRGFLAGPLVLLFLTGVVTAVTVLAGFYPALVLSGFNPIEALKNKIRAGRSSGVSLRRVLVVTQFCIAQFLVIGTLVLVYQMNYFKNKELGFNKDAVITVPFPSDSTGRARVDALKGELLQQPGIKDVSVSLYGPADPSGWFSDFRFNNSPKPVDFGSSLKWADPEYFRLYDMHFVAGGPYKNTDTITGYVVNETLVHKLGITDPNQAIGKYIMIWGDDKRNAPITGVVKDFNAGSLHDPIPPVLMAPWKAFYSKLNIKIEPSGARRALATVERLWNKTYPDGVYEFQFLDKTIADFYKSEDQLAALYKIFAGIAIFISCLGLYGLVSFMTVQRVKEVGIRKTLGASVGNIILLFSKEFTLLVIIAFALSAPIGYYVMHNWLQDFTYRITIGPGILILAVVSSLAIAWLSVGYKAARVAFANPVKSLRSE
ncbi:MAG TPA: ABC transporter permease [Chitinophagaceae bacterium]|nr:ABC transporter permease [Chitinophagaceae bacterium]